MSALALALAAFARSDDGLVAAPHISASPEPTPLSASPESCYSALPSLTSSTSSSTSSLPSTSNICVAQPLRLQVAPERPNEHLAVLLPKSLWKSDSLASQCDNFYCRVRFSMFERRHHCRKCGGVFCAPCTSRTTPLLDASNLSFLHPPRNVPLSSFESPDSPILPSRVCDDCWDQVHGCPTTPRTPELVRPGLTRTLSTPISVLNSPLSAGTSGESSLSSSVATPPNVVPEVPGMSRKPRSLRTAPSHSSLNSTYSRRVTLRTSHLPLPESEMERSYGELDAYPLKRASLLCKATGGGRWEPKQSPVMAGYRVPVPGGKAPFELEMEREEAEERARRENPIVRDGDFQYRFTRLSAPAMMARSPMHLSTF